MRAAFSLISTLVLGVTVAAQQESATPAPQAPVVLSESGSQTVAMAGLHATGNSQCDGSGNLYFNTAMDFNSSAIMKLRPDGRYSYYSLPPGQGKSYFVAFRVNSDGVVYVLNAGVDKLYLYSFSSDTVDPSRTELDGPPGLEPTNFLVFPRGRILINGYFNDKAPKHKGQSYFGHFDASGRLLQDSWQNASDGITGDIKSNSWTLTLAAAAVSENGLGYMLSGDDILVLSATEGLVKTMPMAAPEEGYRPLNISVAGGRLLVTFIKGQDRKPPIPVLYKLLDASTGEEIRTYKPAAQLGNNLVCFSKEGFTFLRVEAGGKLKLINAKP